MASHQLRLRSDMNLGDFGFHLAEEIWISLMRRAQDRGIYADQFSLILQGIKHTMDHLVHTYASCGTCEFKDIGLTPSRWHPCHADASCRLRLTNGPQQLFVIDGAGQLDQM